MDEIYKVTGKKLTALLSAEADRKSDFMRDSEKALLKDLRKLGVKGLLGCNFSRDVWKNSYYISCVVFNKKAPEAEDFDKYWKLSKRKGWWKGKQVDTYYPKENKKIGREISDTFRLHAKQESFFQSEEFIKAVGFDPEKKEDFLPGKIVINNFVPGWYTNPETKERTFFFKPYKGYKPVPGIKEMYPSEYNRLMGDN